MEVTHLQKVNYSGKIYVQMTVIGHNRTWKNWVSLKEFIKNNPDVEI